MTTYAKALLELASQSGLIRTTDLEVRQIPRVELTRLVRGGQLERIGRGLYSLPGREITEHQSLLEAAKKVPKGILCLLSALRWHDLTTQEPFEVWLAIDRKARLPQLDYPPLRIVRFSGRSLLEGIEEHKVDGVAIKVTSAARTVADCFRYRAKIGLDVAIEALRDYRDAGKGSLDDLLAAAEIARVQNVIRPYLEALS